MLKPREVIRALPEYHPPLAGRAGLRLDFNENTVGCSPRVLERVQRVTAEDLARYPERQSVEEKAAKFLGVSADELLLTNGVDEAIHLLCQTFLGPDDDALIVAPTYSMYRIYMMAAGAQVREIRSGPDFRFPINELCNSVGDRTGLIAIANPNNPTGTLAASDEVRRLAASARSAAVLVDEAYFEFCGQTGLSLLEDCSNLFVTRTFSKAYGLAGLRIGALIGSRDHMASVRLACSPYNVNAVALACLPAAIEDREYVQQYTPRYFTHATDSKCFYESTKSGSGRARRTLFSFVQEPAETMRRHSSRPCGSRAFSCAIGRRITDAKAACESRSERASKQTVYSTHYSKRCRFSRGWRGNEKSDPDA